MLVRNRSEFCLTGHACSVGKFEMDLNTFPFLRFDERTVNLCAYFLHAFRFLLVN